MTLPYILLLLVSIFIVNSRKSVTYQVIFDDGTLVERDVKFRGRRTTGIKVMEQAAIDNFKENSDKTLDYKATYFGQFEGYFIDSINNGTAFIPSDCDNFPVDCFFWQLSVNNVVSPVGISLVKLVRDDVLKWEYVMYVPPP